ncbi:nucleoside recognition protein [Methanoculleus sp. Afa-1]|uniref:Nucleoside recognition protein n=1 Tax=Methanoculleus formosensis TaxID=2590886 RepID=A0A9E4ZNC2_9EURY|nr:nucleoside recognition protein [Methanoculleus sp. Afa-1]MCT8337570.1 nucleoside recognition protein [Methanoculleus sp. Afa-1]
MDGTAGIVSAALGLSLELLVRTVPIVVAGVLIAEILIALKITDRIASVAYPVTTFSHLPHECGASFLLAFISPQAADAMLVDYYHKGTIGRSELIIAALINSFPSVVMHWRYLVPVYLPLLGVFGLIYFAVLMGIGFLKTGIVMVAGRVLLHPPPASGPPEKSSGPTLSLREALRASLGPTARTLRRILGIMVPTLVIVAFLVEAGVFDAVAAYLEGASRLFPIPPEGLAIIAAKFGSYIAAASVASALLAAGDMTGKDIVITLLVANLLTSVVTYLRWLGSFYIAIFGPRRGTEIMLLSVTLQDGLLLVAIFLLAWFW